jgi:WD40 repeat protein
MWSIRDGSRRTLWHESNVISVAFSPDGRYVAAGNRDGFVRIWGARTSQLLAKYEIGYEWPRAVIFTSDGKGIVIGGRAVQGLDVGMLKEGRSREHAIQDGTCNLMNPTFEFTGHKVRSSLSSNLKFNKILTVFLQLKGMINALSFSSDNRWLLSCSRDHNVCILDARSSAWVCTLKAHTNYVWGADFSPAGHYIVSGGGDCRVRLWRYELVE